MEDVETQEHRSPNDIDVVTIYTGYDLAFQKRLVISVPEFRDPGLAKANFLVDHYPFDASYSPMATVQQAKYWVQLFSHTRRSVWKGMLEIQLNTPGDDTAAINYLNSL